MEGFRTIDFKAMVYFDELLKNCFSGLESDEILSAEEKIKSAFKAGYETAMKDLNEDDGR